MKKFTNTSEKSALTLSKVLKDGKLKLAAGESKEIKENQLRAGYENITNLFEDLSITSVDANTPLKTPQSEQDIQDKVEEEKKVEELKAKELEAEKLRLLEETKQKELAKAKEEANRKMAELEEKKLKEIQNQKELESQKKSEKVLTDKQEEIKA